MPESLQGFIPAAFCPINTKRPLEKLPEWMDMDKYRRGQKFVRDHYFSLVLSKIFGLIYSYTFDDGRKIVFLGENSHTPYLAFTKYLNTIKRVLSWYDGEPWVKGTKSHKEMQITRAKHLAISRKAAALTNEQIDIATKFKEPWAPEHELLLKDFTMACPFEKLGQCPYKMISKSSVRPRNVNNAYLAGVQGTFLILPFLYPESIGLYGVTHEDLDAFCYLWKCYGYFLGMEDEYNFCSGSFEEVKQRTWDLAQCWIKVNLRNIEPEWVHMTRCLVETMNYYHPLLYVPYKTLTLILAQALDLKMPNLYASLSYGEWIAYKFYGFLLHYGMKFSIVRAMANRIVWKVINAASNFGPEKLAKLHEKSKQQLMDFSIF